MGTAGGTYVSAFFEEGILRLWMGGLVIHPLGWGWQTPPD